jgi:hypothetical protein
MGTLGGGGKQWEGQTNGQCMRKVRGVGRKGFKTLLTAARHCIFTSGDRDSEKAQVTI